MNDNTGQPSPNRDPISGALGAHPVGVVRRPALAQHYEREPYYQRGVTFDDYAPAYRVGGKARDRYGEASFDGVEDELASDYERARRKSRLDWDDARDATKAAWTRVGGK